MLSRTPIVYIVDDDHSIRQSLTTLIEKTQYNVRSYAKASVFLNEYREEGPACLILDIHMPEINGLEVHRELRKRNVSIPIILIADFGDIPTAVGAMKNGAFHFLEKPFCEQTILNSVKDAIEHHSRKLRKHIQIVTFTKKCQNLTPREKQIMKLLIEGKTSKTIGFELGINQKTVDFHRSNLFTKLEVTNPVELVRLSLGAPCG